MIFTLHNYSFDLEFYVELAKDRKPKGYCPIPSFFKSKWKLTIATARCARVSYAVAGTDGKEHDYKADIELHDRLLKSGHMSAFEHCARSMSNVEFNSSNFSSCIDGKEFISIKPNFGWSGNFKGFIQYRKMIPNESVFIS